MPAPGKQANAIFKQTRAADGHHPLAVAFAVTPANDAAKQFAVERLQPGNQLFCRLMRKPLSAGVAADRPESGRSHFHGPFRPASPDARALKDQLRGSWHAGR